MQGDLFAPGATPAYRPPEPPAAPARVPAVLPPVARVTDHVPMRRAVEPSAMQAARLRPRTAEQKRRILAYLYECGPAGATRAEMARDLAIRIQSICPAVHSLVHKEKLILELKDQLRNGGRVLLHPAHVRATTLSSPLEF